MNESRSPSGESSAALAGRSASGSAPQIARRLTPRTPEAGAAFSRGSDRRTECIRKERRFPRRIPLRLERSFALACPSARISACILAAAACALAPSCSEDEIFGDGVGAEAAVTTPSGIQWGKVDIVYTLKHATMTATSVQASYSTNGGVSFLSATEAEGGEGTEDLSVSPDGERHTFVWDSGVDIDQGRFEDLLFRLTPASGKSATSGAFRLHNTVYLAAAHDDAAGVVSLFDLDVTDGDLRSRGSFATGGQSPWDVLFQGGVYYIAHSGSNDVAALGLDEETRLLSPVDGSPFASGGVGTRYLAATGGFLFAANTSGETISIFDIDPATGALALNASSGVQAVGCRSMAARSDFLYVASETAAQIFIFDIEAGGELLPNIYSPIASGGLESPRAMITTPSRLYAANFQTPSICGFSFL
ncbi:MAG: hypothetical protein JXA90_01445, partial [Planctomycetes bacterium]|nr:hypothetical protein [Planctomycetota bacterium]